MTSSPTRDPAREDAAKQRLRTAFEAWAAGTGPGPLDLLAEDATWTIVGNSPVARTYPSRKAFLDTVIGPFNARVTHPLVPSVRGLYADGDWVVVLFDGATTARDGQPYRNTYTWYMRFAPDPEPHSIVEVIAFFDAIEFTELWNRVEPGA